MSGQLWARPTRWGAYLAVVGLILMPVTARAQLGWDGAQTVSAIVPFVDTPRMAIDAQGFVTAAWVEMNQQGVVVRAARRPPVGWWTAPVALSPVLLGGADLVVAAAPSGDVLAVWTADAGVFVSRFSSGSWAPASLVAPRQYAHAPVAALDGAGNAVVLWYLDGTARVEGLTYDAATHTWSAVHDFGDGYGPVVAVDGAGNALAAWSRYGVSASSVVFSTYATVTGLWSPAAPIDSAALAGVGTLSMTPDGTAALLWATANVPMTAYVLKAALFSPLAGTWGTAHTVTSSPIRHADLVVGTADVMVVWSDDRMTFFERFDRASGLWRGPAPFSPATTDYIDLAADAVGGVVAAWTTPDGRVSSNRYSHLLDAWSQPTALSPQGMMTGPFEVVVAPTGSASVAWPVMSSSMAIQAARWQATLAWPDLDAVTPSAGKLTLGFQLPHPALGEFAAQNVEYSTDGGTTWIARSPVSAVSPVVVAGLVDFVDYSLRLRVVNVAGAGLMSPPIVVRAGVGSQEPSGLAAVAIAGNTVSLSWAPPAVGFVPSGYVLEGGVLPGQVLGSVVTGSPASTFTFQAPSGIFYLRVHALFARPGLRSGPSNEVRVVVNVPAPPSPPRALLGLVNGSGIALSWTNTFEGGPPTGISLVASGAATGVVPLGLGETFQFAGVPAGTYTLYVVATNGVGVSAPSNAIVLTFPGTCSGPPLPPTRLTAQAAGRAVSVSWEPPQGGTAVTHYWLDVAGSVSGSFALPGRQIGGGVPPGVYSFSVRAENPCGTSGATAPVALTVP